MLFQIQEYKSHFVLLSFVSDFLSQDPDETTKLHAAFCSMKHEF